MGKKLPNPVNPKANLASFKWCLVSLVLNTASTLAWGFFLHQMYKFP